MKIALSTLLVLLLGVVAGGLAAWHRPPPAARPGELRVVHAASRLSIDPRVVRDGAALGQRIIDALWDPLLTVEDDGEIRAAAAASWEVSADQRRVTLHLRPGLVWSNGEAVTAEDYRRTLRWMEETGYPHPLMQQFQPLRTDDSLAKVADIVSAPDARTLVLSLPEPVPGIVFAIASGAWIPLHRTSPEQIASGRYRRAPGELVTNGAFRLAEVGADVWQLERNLRYRAAADVRLSRVHFARVDGPSYFSPAVASGGADLGDAVLMSRTALPAVVTETTSGISLLHFNVERPPLNDPRVRRALSLALDRETLARSFAGASGEALFSCMPPRPGEPPERTVTEDLAEAKRLLAAAGYPEGRGLPVLKLPLVRSRQPNPIAYSCADQWRSRLGIAVYVIPLSVGEINARLARGEFDIMHFYWTLGRGEASLFAAAPLDALPRAYQLHLTAEQQRQIEQARAQQGEARRVALRAVERELLAAMPCTPVVGYRRSFVIGPRVDGWQSDVSGAHPFAALALKTFTPAP
ncbi:MAG: hypothetical protein KF715_09615 [Candidatus Didemnitutus sp.]|nr:hypothetical protein [Candidatus Didemnitutus sp.]